VSQHDFEAFLLKLIEAQDGVCALTGLPLQFDGEHDDSELLCSLDRVDSSGHYEDGTLQGSAGLLTDGKMTETTQSFGD